MAITSQIEAVPFDPDIYLRHNPDVAAAGIDAYEHYVQYGREEERKGLRKPWYAPSFDEEAYFAAYPDAASLVAADRYSSGAEHWFLVGRREALCGERTPTPTFDETGYLSRRPDVAEALSRGDYVSGFDHWLQWGSKEDRERQQKNSSQRDAPRPIHTTYADNVDREKADFWQQNGFLILEGVISAEQCERVNQRINRVWSERKTAACPPISIDIFLERPDNRRIPMREAPGEARALPYKINDMVMHDDAVRAVAFDDDVVAALRWVLDSDPVAIGSLNFERGSTQRFHTDTLYMPGKTAGGMTAAWFALEDVTTEAGPLLYYRGSHQIPMFRFSSGLPSQINEEVPAYDTHMAHWVSKLGLDVERFLPKQGDVLLWHELLYHGGATIEDIAQTRKSLVVHYWRSDEMRDAELVRVGNGFFWDRPPL